MFEKIFCWRGVFGDPLLLESYRKIIEKIQQGAYQSLSWERLLDSDVISVRINKADRLLFTKILIKGEWYLLLLDEVLNHDYSKSKFLKSGVLKHFLSKHADDFPKIIEDLHFKAVDNPEQQQEFLNTFKKLNHYEYHPADWFNRHYIELNEIQNQVMREEMPCLVGGSPGSGKSCVALTRLSQEVLRLNLSGKPYKLLYTAHSMALVNYMRRMWNQMPESQDAPADAVQFKTSYELLKEFGEPWEETQRVDGDFCRNWLIEYLGSHHRNTKHNSSLIKLANLPDVKEIIQEFQQLSGYDSEEYLLPRKKDCPYTLEQKKWMWDAFKAYGKELFKKNKIDPDFVVLKVKHIFDCILVDESQDLSFNLLKQWISLVKNNQIIFFKNNNQNLSGNQSNTAYIKSCFRHVNFKHIKLPSTYRCPVSVIHLANALLDLKYRLTQGVKDKHEDAQIPLPEICAQKPGSVRWLNDKSPQDSIDELKNMAQNNVQFAVITHEDYTEEAKTKFGTESVFTPEQIKGLEYAVVLAYRLFDKPAFKTAANWLKKLEKASANRPKANALREEGLAASFHELFVALTRSIDALIIYQNTDSHALKPIFSPLLAVTQPALHAVREVQHVQATERDWKRQCETLLDAGNDIQAKNIYLRHVNNHEAEYEAFRRNHLHLQDEDNIIIIERKEPVTRQVVSEQVVPTNHIKPAVLQTGQNSRKKSVVPHTSVKVEENLVDIIIKNPSTVTVNSLLKLLKSPNAFDALFSTKVPKYSCLYSLLWGNSQSAKLFKQKVILKQLDSLILGLSVAQICFLYSDSNLIMEVINIEQNYSFFAKVMGVKCTKKINGISVLTSLDPAGNSPLSSLICRNVFGCDFLSLAIKISCNDQILQSITFESLMVKNPADETPIIQHLLKQKNSDLFYWIYKKNKNFKARVIKAILEDNFLKEDYSGCGKNILYYLASNQDIVIKNDGNYDYKKNIITSLAKNTDILTKINDVLDGTSVVKHFYESKEDYSAVFRIFNLAEKGSEYAFYAEIFSKYITTEILCGVNKKNNISLFSYLTTFEGGILILEQLIANKPEIINEIPRELFVMQSKTGYSALYGLIYHLGPFSIELLHKFTFGRDDFLPLLVIFMARAYKNKDSEPLFWIYFMGLPKGCEIFYSMLKFRPELATHVTMNELQRFVFDHSMSTPLAIMLNDASSLAVLRILLENNKTLTKALGDYFLNAPSYPEKTTFKDLCANPPGDKDIILELLYKEYPELKSKATDESYKNLIKLNMFEENKSKEDTEATIVLNFDNGSI